MAVSFQIFLDQKFREINLRSIPWLDWSQRFFKSRVLSFKLGGTMKFCQNSIWSFLLTTMPLKLNSFVQNYKEKYFARTTNGFFQNKMLRTVRNSVIQFVGSNNQANGVFRSLTQLGLFSFSWWTRLHCIAHQNVVQPVTNQNIIFLNSTHNIAPNSKTWFGTKRTF